MLNKNKILNIKGSIIVSGSSGFIGFNFAEYVLRNSNIKIFAYREKEVNASNNFRLKILKTYKNFYLINNKSISNLKENIKVVFNFASYGVDSRQKDINNMLDGNIKFSLKMIEISHKFNAKYVHTSSCYEYKDSNIKINEKTLLRPNSLYGVFKAATTNIVEQVCKYKKIKHVIIYLFGVYGPYESGTKILPSLFKSLSRNESIKLTNGEQIRDYTYIEDIVKGCLLLGIKKTKKNKYNLCSSKGTAIKKFIFKFVKIGKFNHRLLKFGKKKMKENNFFRVVGDNQNISKEFDWKPKISIEKGMKLAIDEFRKRDVI